MNGKILTAEDILGAQDRKLESVDVPEWGGKVFIRPLSAEDLVDSVDVKKADALPAFLVMSLVNEAGIPLFKETDIPKLRKKNFRVMLRLQDLITEINGLPSKAKPAEAALKNG